jgi:acyl carrier protein
MEKTNNITQEILAMLAKQLNKKPAEITNDKRIKEDLGADSLDVVEILMGIEDKYGMTIPDEVLYTIKTVGDLVRVVDGMK